MQMDSPYASSQEFFDPTPGLTPTSVNSNTFLPLVHPHAQQQPQQLFPVSPVSNGFMQTFNDPNYALPDLSSFMFPGDDPFQYPQQGQPLTSFDNGTRGQNAPDFTTMFPASSAPTSNPQAPRPSPRRSFIPPSSSFNPKGVPDTPNQGDTEVQLLGPMPMYMMQGANNQQQAHSFVGLPNQQQHVAMNDFGLFDGCEGWQGPPDFTDEFFAGIPALRGS